MTLPAPRLSDFGWFVEIICLVAMIAVAACAAGDSEVRKSLTKKLPWVVLWVAIGVLTAGALAFAVRSHAWPVHDG